MSKWRQPGHLLIYLHLPIDRRFAPAWPQRRSDLDLEGAVFEEPQDPGHDHQGQTDDNDRLDRQGAEELIGQRGALVRLIEGDDFEGLVDGKDPILHHLPDVIEIQEDDQGHDQRRRHGKKLVLLALVLVVDDAVAAALTLLLLVEVRIGGDAHTARADARLDLSARLLLALDDQVADGNETRVLVQADRRLLLLATAHCQHDDVLFAHAADALFPALGLGVEDRALATDAFPAEGQLPAFGEGGHAQRERDALLPSDRAAVGQPAKQVLASGFAADSHQALIEKQADAGSADKHRHRLDLIQGDLGRFAANDIRAADIVHAELKAEGQECGDADPDISEHLAIIVAENSAEQPGDQADVQIGDRRIDDFDAMFLLVRGQLGDLRLMAAKQGIEQIDENPYGNDRRKLKHLEGKVHNKGAYTIFIRPRRSRRSDLHRHGHSLISARPLDPILRR